MVPKQNEPTVSEADSEANQRQQAALRLLVRGKHRVEGQRRAQHQTMPTDHSWETENENTGNAESEDKNRPARARKKAKENWERQGGPQLLETRGEDVTGWERRGKSRKNTGMNQSCADSDDKHRPREQL